jgi:hypothetical protein
VGPERCQAGLLEGLHDLRLEQATAELDDAVESRQQRTARRALTDKDVSVKENSIDPPEPVSASQRYWSLLFLSGRLGLATPHSATVAIRQSGPAAPSASEAGGRVDANG